MKTKLSILAMFVALFGFTAANAQGRGNGKGNKGNKGYAKKMKKQDRHYDYRNRGKVYRDRDDDDDDDGYRGSRRGTVYYPGGIFRNRDDDDYRRRRGNVYYPTRQNLPPGQAKKIYGHQSAKAFAPGQQKKAYRNSDVYYPQRRVINDRRYNDDYYRTRQTGELARRIGSIFGL